MLCPIHIMCRDMLVIVLLVGRILGIMHHAQAALRGSGPTAPELKTYVNPALLGSRLT